MKLIDSVWNKLTQIEITEVDSPTHIEVPKDMIPVLINEYNELLSDFDFDQFGEKPKKFNINDIASYFGLTLTVSLSRSNDIKILKEIIPNIK